MLYCSQSTRRSNYPEILTREGQQHDLMADAMISNAITSLIRAQLERRPTELRDIALILVPGESSGDKTMSRRHILCCAGIAPEFAAQFAEGAANRQQLIAQAIHEGRAITGGPIPGGGPMLDRSFWCATPAGIAGSVPRTVLVGLAAQPFTAAQCAALEQVAAITGAILAGAETAMQERRETEQLSLLMTYAANPIILSDGQVVVSMNEPAQRLFDAASAVAGDNLGEQQGIIAHNFALLQDFFGEVRQEHDAIHSGELTLRDPQTQEELIMAIACTHAPSAEHGDNTLVSVLHDMTRARELEHHRVRQQLFESEKMAATGRLAASIAHEINNPLEAIKNSLYLLVQQTGDDDPNRQFLQIAQRETERVSRIIRQMLGVSRPSVAFAPTQINDVLHEALQLLGPQLRQGRVTLTVQLSETLPLVKASADQIKQVFLN